MVVLVNNHFRLMNKTLVVHLDYENNTLRKRLKEARLARGLTQKALGDLVGVSQAAIQKIETGKANQTTKIVEIANALGVRRMVIFWRWKYVRQYSATNTNNCQPFQILL